MTSSLRILLGHTLSASLGALLACLLMIFYFDESSRRSQTWRDLSDRMESISIDEVCDIVKSGKQLDADDHVTIWFDQRRYILVGWRPEQSGSPAVYWTGADLPAECRPR